ncbi:MAG: SDR family NAD(P)-dependent oxidoreductase [Gammaproteobacteria bacterium]|nr:SDR family NAD(P)-dependent oxidoreductase [Gammaproteobacteria bacterium]
MDNFTGKTVVITGAASGIGRAMANRLASEGARLVLADVEVDALETLRASLEADAIAVPCDVADSAACEMLAERAYQAFGATHLLLNNAGIMGRFAPIWDQDPDDWQWTFGVNVLGVANMLRAFVPRMLEQDDASHIVNTASEAALGSRAFVGVYHASKHAVLAITETLAQELGFMGADIRVSVLCPGGVDTKVLDASRNRPADFDPAREQDAAPDGLQAMYRRNLSRAMAPEQVADAVVEGVRKQRFYIFSHPEVADLAQTRADAVAKDIYPVLNEAMAARIRGEKST